MKKIILFLLVLVSNCFSQYNPQFLTQPSVGYQINLAHPDAQGLTAFYLFNEGHGGKIYDISGNGGIGVLTNLTPLDAWVTGRDGYAIEFDGTANDKIVFSDVSVSTTFTFSVWIRPNSPSGSYGVITMNAAGSLGFEHRGSGAGGPAGLMDFFHDGTDHHSDSPLIDQAWNHFACSVLEGSYTFYLNGVPDGTDTGADAMTFQIFGDHGSEPYLGAISDVRFYDRSLTSEEIWSLFIYPYAIFEQPPGRILAAAAVAAVERRRLIIAND